MQSSCSASEQSSTTRPNRSSTETVQVSRTDPRPEALTKAQRQGWELPGAVDAMDNWLIARWGRRRGPVVDRLMVASSRAADYWVVWLILAAGLSVLGGERGRIAARRGVIALVVASATANGPIKLAVQRRRPIGLRRADLRALRSSSFPSAHTAAAIAFATAVTRTWSGVGVFVLPLAVLVSASRVYLGAHYPSDVLVGGAVGVAVAVGVSASPITRRLDASHESAATTSDSQTQQQ